MNDREAVTAAALVACRQIADAYDDGARRGGSIDWADLDDANRYAREALALAGDPRPEIDDDDGADQ